MKISTRGEYGIRAMLYLAEHGVEKSVTSREIASRQAIPEPYLRQILALLSKHRFIQSNRGPQGGHTLARDPSEITVRDVLMVLEGQTTSIDQILALPCDIGVGTEHCVIREVFLEVKRAVDTILGGTSLADLVARQKVILAKNIRVPHDVGEVAGDSRLPVLSE